MKDLTLEQTEAVQGGGNVSAGLAAGAAVLGTAAAITRFFPGTQMLSAGFTVLGLGVGGLGYVAKQAGL